MTRADEHCDKCGGVGEHLWIRVGGIPYKNHGVWHPQDGHCSRYGCHRCDNPLDTDQRSTSDAVDDIGKAVCSRCGEVQPGIVREFTGADQVSGGAATGPFQRCPDPFHNTPTTPDAAKYDRASLHVGSCVICGYEIAQCDCPEGPKLPDPSLHCPTPDAALSVDQAYDVGFIDGQCDEKYTQSVKERAAKGLKPGQLEPDAAMVERVRDAVHKAGVSVHESWASDGYDSETSPHFEDLIVENVVRLFQPDPTPADDGLVEELRDHDIEDCTKAMGEPCLSHRAAAEIEALTKRCATEREYGTRMTLEAGQAEARAEMAKRDCEYHERTSRSRAEIIDQFRQRAEEAERLYVLAERERDELRRERTELVAALRGLRHCPLCVLQFDTENKHCPIHRVVYRFDIVGQPIPGRALAYVRADLPIYGESPTKVFYERTKRCDKLAAALRHVHAVLHDATGDEDAVIDALEHIRAALEDERE